MLTCLSLGHGGRLANQMFQVAGVIGLAQKFDHNFCFPYWKNHEHKDKFGSNEDIDVQSWFKNKLPLNPGVAKGFKDMHIEFNTNPDSISIDPNYNWNITQHYSGHLQSEKYFAHCKDLIRHYFSFHHRKVYRCLGRGVNPWQHENNCGIHVRIGDYAKPDSMQPVLTTEYYKEAMQLFPASTKFIVFSDEPEKAKQIIEPTGMKCIYVSGNHYMADLLLMTMCDNFIIANSTFSWWGAWLINKPDKKIVAPSTWWTDNARKEWGYSTKDLFPEGWIVI